MSVPDFLGGGEGVVVGRVHDSGVVEDDAQLAYYPIDEQHISAVQASR